jgi:hypothetical protein
LSANPPYLDIEEDITLKSSKKKEKNQIEWHKGRSNLIAQIIQQ